MLGFRMPMPRIHFALVKYGLEAHAATAERDFFRGSHLYAMYNTHQLHYEEHDVGGSFRYLSPWHLKGRYMTKAQIIKYCGKVALFLGLMIGACATYYGMRWQGYRPPEPSAVLDSQAVADLAGVVINDDHTIAVTDKNGHAYNLDGFRLDGRKVFVTLPDGKIHSYELQP